MEYSLTIPFKYLTFTHMQLSLASEKLFTQHMLVSAETQSDQSAE